MNNLLSDRRILVVEDEMLVLMTIEDMLTDLDCKTVAAAPTVDQALTLIGAQGFDAAMLDMNLNGDQSYAVADALAAQGVPFIFSTGYGGREVRDDYRDRPLLKKPFAFEELMEKFSRLLAPDRQ